MSQCFWEISAQRKFYSRIESRASLLFLGAAASAARQRYHAAVVRVRPPAFAELEQGFGLAAFRVFCRRCENRCARQNRPRAKHLCGRAEKSTASPPSSARRRATSVRRTMISSSDNFSICRDAGIVAGQGFFRDVADGRDFGEGKAAGADLFVRDFRQIFRLGKPASGKKFFEPRREWCPPPCHGAAGARRPARAIETASATARAPVGTARLRG